MLFHIAPNVPVILNPTESSFVVKVTNDVYARGTYTIVAKTKGKKTIIETCRMIAEACSLTELLSNTQCSVSASMCPDSLGKCSAQSEEVVVKTAVPGNEFET